MLWPEGEELANSETGIKDGKEGSPTNSETGTSAERPVNPLQRAVLHKEQQREY